MIRAAANYVCMMELQHYQKNFFCQICRRIIVLIPKWWTRRFVNVSAAMVKLWQKYKLKARWMCGIYYFHLLFFFLNQIKLVFTHELVKGYPLWRAKNKKAERVATESQKLLRRNSKATISQADISSLHLRAKLQRSSLRHMFKNMLSHSPRCEV